jgi:hypothetical protein
VVVEDGFVWDNPWFQLGRHDVVVEDGFVWDNPGAELPEVVTQRLLASK